MTVQIPIPDFAAARRAMVDSQLRPLGVTDPAVLEAMGSVPREHFVPEDSRPLAYADRAVALGDGRFLAAPAVLGQLLTQMCPKPGSARSLSAPAPAIPPQCWPGSARRDGGGKRPGACRSRPRTRAHRGRGTARARSQEGRAVRSVLIDGAVEYIPEPIIEQLGEGGRLGAALTDRGITRLIVGRKSGIAFGYLSIADAGVPALPGFICPKAFTF